MVFGFFAVALLLFILMCRSGDKPGEGRTAAAGYRWGVPAIAALENYRGDHRRYPDKLRLLAPRYIAEEALTPPPVLRAVIYQLDRRDGYSLSFGYTGPPSDTCIYTPAKRSWSCSGAW